ncbi:hypothetical protein ACI797_05565 [Geodermatophilus sp. SYSU D00691]
MPTYVVFLDRSRPDWQLHVPELDIYLAVSWPFGAEQVVAAQIAAATGRAPGDFRLRVVSTDARDTYLQDPGGAVEVRHRDGGWYAGTRLGWLRHTDGRWRALVCYDVHGVEWERAVPGARLRTGIAP